MLNQHRVIGKDIEEIFKFVTPWMGKKIYFMRKYK